MTGLAFGHGRAVRRRGNPGAIWRRSAAAERWSSSPSRLGAGDPTQDQELHLAQHGRRRSGRRGGAHDLAGQPIVGAADERRGRRRRPGRRGRCPAAMPCTRKPPGLHRRLVAEPIDQVPVGRAAPALQQQAHQRAVLPDELEDLEVLLDPLVEQLGQASAPCGRRSPRAAPRAAPSAAPASPRPAGGRRPPCCRSAGRSCPCPGPRAAAISSTLAVVQPARHEHRLGRGQQLDAGVGIAGTGHDRDRQLMTGGSLIAPRPGICKQVRVWPRKSARICASFARRVAGHACVGRIHQTPVYDSHCHLDLPVFDGDRAQVVLRAQHAPGVTGDPGARDSPATFARVTALAGRVLRPADQHRDRRASPDRGQSSIADERARPRSRRHRRGRAARRRRWPSASVASTAAAATREPAAGRAPRAHPGGAAAQAAAGRARAARARRGAARAGRGARARGGRRHAQLLGRRRPGARRTAIWALPSRWPAR